VTPFSSKKADLALSKQGVGDKPNRPAPAAPRILIVDDEAAIRSRLSVAFARAGYEVRTAADALQAMALCASESFDAMLSDVVMPMMDGHDLVQWVVRNYPKIRCVLMTAVGVDCQDCSVAPRCRLLPKPFRLKDALSQIGHGSAGMSEANRPERHWRVHLP